MSCDPGGHAIGSSLQIQRFGRICGALSSVLEIFDGNTTESFQSVIVVYFLLCDNF